MSSKSERERLWAEAWAEVLEEKRELEKQGQKVESSPYPSRIVGLAEKIKTPPGKVLLGVEPNHRPLFLNLEKPEGGPILVISDAEQSNGSFMTSVADSITRSHRPDNMNFIVFTNTPSMWSNQVDSKNCTNVLGYDETAAGDFILSLASEAHSRFKRGHTVVFFENLNETGNSLNLEDIMNITWLIKNGSRYKTRVIASVTTQSYKDIDMWRDHFRTRVFGQSDRNGRLYGSDTKDLSKLLYENEYHAVSGKNAFDFWLPR